MRRKGYQQASCSSACFVGTRVLAVFILFTLCTGCVFSERATMLRKAVKNLIGTLQEGESIVGLNRSFREDNIFNMKHTQRYREGYTSLRVDFIVHRKPRNKIFPGIGQLHFKACEMGEDGDSHRHKVVKVSFDADPEFVATWRAEQYMIERILARHPYCTTLLVSFDQMTRKDRGNAWKLCCAIVSAYDDLKFEIQRTAHDGSSRWDLADNVCNPSREHHRFASGSSSRIEHFVPPHNTVARLSGNFNRKRKFKSIKSKERGEGNNNFNDDDSNNPPRNRKVSGRVSELMQRILKVRGHHQHHHYQTSNLDAVDPEIAWHYHQFRDLDELRDRLCGA
mmetsp:Transcript_17574/g.28622  ORF Transcript_17574/g.28622 Transcript_17574/m.28622 type:complete len:338 (-) Transcript_17574:248-1261(-)